MSEPSNISGPNQPGPETDWSERMEHLLVHRAGPLPVSERRKREVWARLNAVPTGPRAWLRPTRLVPIAVLLIAGGASAYLHSIQPAPDPASSRAQESSAPSGGVHDGQQPEKDASSEPASPAGDMERSESETDDGVHQETALPNSRATQKPEEGSKAGQPTSVQPADRDLLWEAMEARRSGDLEKMNQLAEEYRKERPTGALEEEALALSLEAAIAKDSPRKKPLAREYLDKYPQGRFATLAKKTLEKTP